MTVESPAFEFHHGNGGAMWQLAAASVDLVVTSPPYYPAHLEPVLREPVERQDRVNLVDAEVTRLAVSLAPVFGEVARVLRPDGRLVVQTRDIRYGGYLLGPADVHRQLAEAAGFHLAADIAWESAPARRSRDGAVAALWARGQFVTAEVERFLVFGRGQAGAARRARPVEAPAAYAEPLWRLPAQGARGTHPHESPMSVLRRLVEVCSEPGDLVLDPMCGHGTTVLVALELGRRGIGYDIDAACVDRAREKAAGWLARNGGPRDGQG